MDGGGGGGGAFDDGVAAGDLAIWHYSGAPCLCGVYVRARRGPAAVCAACVNVPRTVARRAARAIYSDARPHDDVPYVSDDVSPAEEARP